LKATPALVRICKAALVAEVARRTVQVEKQQSHLSQEIQRVDRQIEELVRMRASGLITDEEFRSQKSRFLDRRHSFQSKARDNPVDVEEIPRNVVQIEELLLEPVETWHAMTPTENRRFQQLLLPVGFFNGRIGTAEKARICGLFRASTDPKSYLVAQTVQTWNRIVDEIRGLAEILRDRTLQKLPRPHENRAVQKRAS
jgi:hypothetical protein